MRSGLTKRMQAAYDAIVSFEANYGCTPTMRELQSLMNLSNVFQAHNLVMRLEARGWITRHSCAARSIRIVKEFIKCPHCGASIRKES